MIYYEDQHVVNVLEAVENLAYRIARLEHPTWVSIPEEEIVAILRAEGVDCREELS